MEVCFFREPCDIQYTRIARLAVPSSHRDWLSCILYGNDKSSRHFFPPMQLWLRLQCLVLNVARFFLGFLSPPVLHRLIAYEEQTRFVYFCTFKLFNSPVDSVSRWCNTNIKLHTATQEPKRFFYSTLSDPSYADAILLFSSALPMATNFTSV
jgi:hypothetical protein